MSVINSYNISTTPENNVLVNIGGEETVYNNGDMAWILVASALVFIMVPGLGFFYSGLLRQKNASSMLFLAFAVYSVVAIQWFFWGYSLAFTENGNPFLGNLDNFGFINVVEQPSGSIPVLLFALYQMQFACVTTAIYAGAFAERARLAPVLVFAFFWATIAYSAFVHWVWNADGWSAKLGDMDFAGGGPVHMSSGAAALAISIFLGKRRGYRTEVLAYRPQNVGYVVLGTTLLWFGWIGFNGGSALAMNLQAVQATVVTMIAASMGGLTWMSIDAFKTKRWSTISFCSGIIAGLVGITPGAGYVATPSALAIGFVTAACSNLSTYLGHLLGYDDALDIFAAHGVSGFVGAILTALFAEAKYANLGGGVSAELEDSDGGWVNHYWVQLGYNLAAAVAVIAWSMVVSFGLLFIINYIPGLHFRASEEDEIVGIDLAQSGEHIYGGIPQHHAVESGHFSEKHTGSEGSSPA